jgi:hypothetical protein
VLFPSEAGFSGASFLAADRAVPAITLACAGKIFLSEKVENSTGDMQIKIIIVNMATIFFIGITIPFANALGTNRNPTLPEQAVKHLLHFAPRKILSSTFVHFHIYRMGKAIFQFSWVSYLYPT